MSYIVTTTDQKILDVMAAKGCVYPTADDIAEDILPAFPCPAGESLDVHMAALAAHAQGLINRRAEGHRYGGLRYVRHCNTGADGYAVGPLPPERAEV